MHMEDVLEKIMSDEEKTLDEVSKKFKMNPRDVLELIMKRERTLTKPVPSPAHELEKQKKASIDERKDEQLAAYFLNRLKKESLSADALNNKYKVKDLERVERILENLIREEKLTRRESRNKKGRFVYEAPGA
jgi:hypothetical protein